MFAHVDAAANHDAALPDALQRRRGDRHSPAGAKMMAASAACWASHRNRPPRCSPTERAKACAAMSPGRVKAWTPRASPYAT